MATPKLPPVYVVTWLDASDAFPTWSPRAKADEVEQLVTSVGHLVDAVPDHLTLATSCVWSGDELHYGGGIHIPLSLVRSKRKLSG